MTEHAFTKQNGADLIRYGQQFCATFSAATPFPHVIIDDLFTESCLDKLIEDFPPADAKLWQRWVNQYEDKFSSTEGDLLMPSSIQSFLRFLNSAQFVRFCEAISGINGLITDPFYHGAGITQVLPGGRLGVHKDFNRHRYTGLERTLSLFVYLNKDWPQQFGGDLELWDEHQCQVKIPPRFNRLILFLNQENGLHGHPTPLSCPTDRRRISISTVYYLNPLASEQIKGYQKPGFI